MYGIFFQFFTPPARLYNKNKPFYLPEDDLNQFNQSVIWYFFTVPCIFY